MKTVVKPYLLKIYLLTGIATFMGVAMSFLIYFFSEQVRNNAIDLVEDRIPILTSINQLIADLSEQERTVYEYYRSQDSDQFEQDFTHNKSMFVLHRKALDNYQYFSHERDIIVTQQLKIESLLELFHFAMQAEEENWDDLRDLLRNISQIRRDLLPTLLMVEKKTQDAVTQGHKVTLSKMALTHNTVIFYGFTIVFIALIFAWYIKQYILTNAKNTRLALFPHLNPNPIISVNNIGEVIFSNPACQKLLNKMGREKDNVRSLIPDNFQDIRQQVHACNNYSLVLEQMIGENVLQVSINWLQEVDAYDIHIMDITERKLAEQQVNHLAFYDQATNLPNQYKLNEHLEQLLKSKQAFTFSIFEITNFTRIVTACGTDGALELTKAFVVTIVGELPEQWQLYQLNEHQFALLYPKKMKEPLLHHVAQELTALVEEPIITSFGEFFVDLNFGFSQSPQHGTELNIMFKKSHLALSIAVDDEHNNASLFKPEFAECLDKQATMRENLRNAIVLNEFFLVFQPQLDLKSQKITGFETLVRWRHQGNIISPAEFIPLAEESGLIVPIGHWILTQACYFAKKLVDAGYEDIVVAVNVSPRQFSHPQFVESVVNILVETNLPTKNLELEITEGIIMHNEAETFAVLHELKSLGLQLSIDDFGTGYSSLSYLKRFPVDKLKIDQSFIMDSHNNDEDKVLVKTIVALGKSLGLSLIAEGVEEKAHVDFLTDIECDEIQGYWYSRPLEADKFVEFLNNSNTL
jgi:EAL domain-containing protein (putative c-di-GMP-specific phosphodiesterase class I)/GGDEF domain-containing protein